MLRRVAIICVALIALTIKHVDGSTQVASCEYQGLSGSVRFFRETDGTLSINETEIPSKVDSSRASCSQLILTDKQLTSLPAGAFSGLSVTFVSLNDNLLTSLPAGAFSDLTTSLIQHKTLTLSRKVVDSVKAPWREVLLEAEIGSSLRLHYPTLTQHGCHLYVAYSRFYSKTMEPDDPGGSFNQQGIIVKRVTILPA